MACQLKNCTAAERRGAHPSLGAHRGLSGRAEPVKPHPKRHSAVAPRPISLGFCEIPKVAAIELLTTYTSVSTSHTVIRHTLAVAILCCKPCLARAAAERFGMDLPTLAKCPGYNLYISGYESLSSPLLPLNSLTSTLLSA